MGADTPTPELNAALAKVQETLPDVAKNQTGEVKGVTKEGKPYSYDYKYADLDAISAAIMPLLGKNGLAYTCEPAADGQDRVVLDYALLHESGQQRAGRFPLWLVLPQRFTAQTIGGLITYFRRYILCAVTGVAPGGDTDAAGMEEAREVHMDRARPQPRPPSDVPSAPVTPGPRAGKEHERLRHGTVEATPDDRRAQRAKSPSDDEWTDQPATVSPVITARSKAIVMRLEELEVHDREERLGITARLAGWPEGKTLNSTNDLSRAQSERVLAQLADLTGHEELMALVTNDDTPGKAAK